MFTGGGINKTGPSDDGLEALCHGDCQAAESYNASQNVPGSFPLVLKLELGASIVSWAFLGKAHGAQRGLGGYRSASPKASRGGVGWGIRRIGAS